jgi:aquaporin NIP
MRMPVAATATRPGILDSSCQRHRCTLVLYVLFGTMDRLGMTLSAGSDGQCFGREIMLTFVIMFVIMAFAADDRVLGQAAAIAIGEVVLLDARFGGPIRSASMNSGPVAGRALTSAS